MKNNFKFAIVHLAVALAFSPVLVSAQNAPASTGDVLRNIETNTTLPKPRSGPVVPEEKKPEDNTVYIKKLVGVSVDNDLIKTDIEAYWSKFLNQPVTNSNINQFKDWAWEKFRQEGYFAFLYTDFVESGDGATLEIKISLPKIHKFKVYSAQNELAEQYTEVLMKRLAHQTQEGSTVDTLSLEQLLENSSFDLPLELEMSIRPSGSDGVDLVVDVKAKASDPGKFKNGVVQVNNYGLSQYGREQVLANLTFEGFTAGSTASLLAQASQGVQYGRFDYEAPSELLAGHWRAWVETVNSRNVQGGSAATNGTTRDYGIGLTHILWSNRDMVFKSALDFTQRYTSSTLQESDIPVSNITDNQIRWHISADNETLATRDIQRYSVGVVAGTDNVNGSYSKFDASASYRTPLNDSGLSIVAKGNAQFAPSRNLDTYNRIALGGVNGVRAYTTIDGVGDAGAVGSIELRQTIFNSHYIGVFYDAGIVMPNQSAIDGAYNTTYTLQAIGLSLGGVIQELNNTNYTVSVARGIGGYAGYSDSNVESSPNNWRINAAVSYPF